MSDDTQAPPPTPMEPRPRPESPAPGPEAVVPGATPSEASPTPAFPTAPAPALSPAPASADADGDAPSGAPSPDARRANPREEQVRRAEARVAEHASVVTALVEEIGRVVVGQSELVDRVLIALLADGHILLEGVPGLAKTLLVKTVAQAIHADFSRIQFTPDLLPADLVGTLVYDPKATEFTVHKGPIFTNLVLADEVNRAPAKVQSALLESMQERQVTIGDVTYPLPQLFLVLATQNPIEQEGTYPLPEAQVDRFMMKVHVGYPSRSEERLIIDRMTGSDLPEARAVVTPAQLVAARAAAGEIYVDDKIKDYVLDLIGASRDPAAFGLRALSGLIEYGASPRAGIYLVMTARAHAFLDGRGFVTPDDVKAVAPDVLRHRVIPSYEAEAEEVSGGDLVQRILEGVDVP